MRKLFTPLMLNKLELANRIVCPPMACHSSNEEGLVTEKLINHYAALGGLGLIIVESCYINHASRLTNKHLGIHNDSCVSGLSRLAQVIHETGAKCGIQISHNGSSCKEEIIGRQPIGPSAVSHPKEGSMPREITIPEMNDLVQEFILAARRAKLAGFDMLEIHCAHGYLLNQFLSPYTNRRGDDYGGSLQNRLRFALEVYQAIRTEVGPDYPIFCRLGANDDLEGGLTLEEGAEAAVLLAKAGIDVMDLSGGLMGARSRSGEAYNLYMSEKIKPLLTIPVLVTGGITTPETAEKILVDGKADLIGIGRALLANPNWAVDAAK